MAKRREPPTPKAPFVTIRRGMVDLDEIVPIGIGALRKELERNANSRATEDRRARMMDAVASWLNESGPSKVRALDGARQEGKRAAAAPKRAIAKRSAGRPPGDDKSDRIAKIAKLLNAGKTKGQIALLVYPQVSSSKAKARLRAYIHDNKPAIESRLRSK